MVQITSFIAIFVAVLVSCNAHPNEKDFERCYLSIEYTLDAITQVLENVLHNTGEKVDLPKDTDCFFGCVFHANGYIFDNNTLNHAKLCTFRDEIGLTEEQKQIGDKCAKSITSEDRCKIAEEMLNCGAMSGSLALLGKKREYHQH